LIIGEVVALVAVHVGLDEPPPEPPQVHVVVPPGVGNDGLAGLVIPDPALHMVPEKAVSL
jgi:hypothetical protein